MSNIKAVLWDVDGTLLDFLAAEREAIKTCFSLFGLGECTDEMIAQYSAINVRWWQALERGEYTKPEDPCRALCGVFHRARHRHRRCPGVNAEYQLRLGDTIKFCPHAHRNRAGPPRHSCAVRRDERHEDRAGQKARALGA